MYDGRDVYTPLPCGDLDLQYSITEGVTEYFTHVQTMCTRPPLRLEAWERG